MISTATVIPPHAPDTSAGGHLVSDDGRDLVLRETKLVARAKGGLAHVRLHQTFHNPHEQPLRVTYKLPLPADGAVGGFCFRIGDRLVRGEVDRTERARERFERAIVDGHTAAILDEERTSLFSQEIGNIPPGTVVEVEVEVDQRLRWLPEGRWEWRFPTVVGPRYMGADGRVADADTLQVPVRDPSSPGATRGPRARLQLIVADALHPKGNPDSPSHVLRIEAHGDQCEVAFAEESGAALDRDVVVQWAAAGSDVIATLDQCRPGAGHARSGDAFGLLTLTPPESMQRASSLARDLIVLIDTSGSMGGEPLDQAAHVVHAIIDTLDDRDRIEMIEFASRPRRWKRLPVVATEANRCAARNWVSSLRAGGGTEMRGGIVEALKPLSSESQRQVVLITDGYIGFEREIVAAIGEQLPSGSRVHTIGVGHGVNRSLTEAAARAGRGLEILIAPGEDPERAAARLVARTNAPCLVNLTVEGTALIDHAPTALPDLFAGSPVVIPVRLSPKGGSLRIAGRGPDGAWDHELKIPSVTQGKGDLALARCYARESVADLETRRAMGDGGEVLDRRVEAIGLEFQISTRLTSWVAISDEAMVDPTDPTLRHEVAQAMVAGLSLRGLGLRPVMTVPAMASMLMPQAPPAAAPASFVSGAMRARSGGPKAEKAMKRFEQAFDAAADDEEPSDLGAPKRGTGLFGRVADGIRDAVDGLLGDGDATEVSRPIPARLVSWTDDTLILEFEIVGTLEWDPKTVVIGLADGARVEVEVDETRTTRAGSIPAGSTVRIVLRLASKLVSKPTRAEIGRVEEGERARLVLRIGG